jgi:hypothetical protein
MFFCLATAHVVAAAKMKTPDAVLNDCWQTMVMLSLAPDGRTLAGPSVPQEAANLAAGCVQDFLHRWSSYVDVARGNPTAATALIAAKLKDVESTTAATAGDADRFLPLARWIEGALHPMRDAFR